MSMGGKVRGIRRWRAATVAGAAAVAGLGLVAQAALFVSPAEATPLPTCTWTGASSTNMSDAGNWTAANGATCGSTNSGNELIFPASPTNDPKLDINQTPDDLVFQTGVNYAITDAGAYTLTLTGSTGITANASAEVDVPVVLGGNQTDSIGANTLTFGSTVTGSGNSLTVSGAGTVAFDGAVGPLAGLTVTSATTGVNTGTITTTGAQSYGGAVTLGATSNLTGSTVQFSSTVDGSTAGGQGLTVTGDAVFDGSVGSATKLASLSVTGGTTDVDTGAITTAGTQSYSGDSSVSHNTTFTGTTVTFGGTLNSGSTGAFSVTVAGNAVFSGSVGATYPLSSLAVTGTATIGGANIATTGNQTYSGATVITSTAETLFGALVTFSSSVDGASNVTPTFLTITGDAAFNGPVNPNDGLKSISVSGEVSANPALSMSATTTYNVAIGGTPVSGSYTQTTVSNGGGNINLTNATLSVGFANGYTSTAGQVYDILVNKTGFAITGTFNGLPQGAYVAAGTRFFQISYTGGLSGHDVTLTDVTPVAPASAVASVGTASVVYGAETAESFTDTLTGYSGLLPTGSVTFTSGATTLCKATTFTKVSTNVETASCALTATELPAAAVAYPVAAVYSGDSSYQGVTSAAPSGFAVTRDTTTVAVIPSLTSLTYGSEQQAVLHVTLTTGHGETLPAGGESATVSVGDGTCVAALSPTATGATGSCSLSPAAIAAGGPYSVGVSYPGDTDLQPSGSTAVETITVAPAATSTVLSISRRVVVFGRESAVVFRVRVQATGVTPTGVVVVSSSGRRLCSIRLSGGGGTCSPGRTQLRAGVYGNLAASYLGTGDFLASQSRSIGQLTIYRDGTYVRLSQSSSSVAYGSEHSVLFTISVHTRRGELVPNGEKVTLHVGSVTCTVRLHGGSARCRIPNVALRPGTYRVVATYGGDFGRHASSSRPGRLTVT